jgi:hypothetical protein
MQIIVTVNLPATATKGTRIRAKYGTITATLPYDHSVGYTDNHDRAALEVLRVAKKAGLATQVKKIIRGSDQPGKFIYVAYQLANLLSCESETAEL